MSLHTLIQPLLPGRPMLPDTRVAPSYSKALQHRLRQRVEDNALVFLAHKTYPLVSAPPDPAPDPAPAPSLH